MNGYYKAELIRGPTRCGPWKTVADVELATLGWVHWHTTARLHGYLGDIPPTEYEQAFYAAHRTDRCVTLRLGANDERLSVGGVYRGMSVSVVGRHRLPSALATPQSRIRPDQRTSKYRIQ